MNNSDHREESVLNNSINNEKDKLTTSYIIKHN